LSLWAGGVWFDYKADVRATAQKEYDIKLQSQRKTTALHNQKKERLTQLCGSIHMALPRYGSPSSPELELILTEAYDLEKTLRDVPDGVPFVQYVHLAHSAMNVGHFRTAEGYYNRALAILKPEKAMEGRYNDEFKVYSSMLDLYQQWTFYTARGRNDDERRAFLLVNIKKAEKTYALASTMIKEDKITSFYKPGIEYEIDAKMYAILAFSGTSLVAQDAYKEEFERIKETLDKLKPALLEKEKAIINFYGHLRDAVDPQTKRKPDIPNTPAWPNKKMTELLEEHFRHLDLRDNYDERKKEKDKSKDKN